MLPIEHNRTLGNIEHNRTLHATIELKASFMRCVQISYGRDPFNQNSNRSDREKWSTSKGGPVFSKLFRLDRTDPLSFGPKFSEILVEWIAPYVLDFNFIDEYAKMSQDGKREKFWKRGIKATMTAHFRRQCR